MNCPICGRFMYKTYIWSEQPRAACSNLAHHIFSQPWIRLKGCGKCDKLIQNANWLHNNGSQHELDQTAIAYMKHLLKAHNGSAP